MEQAHKTMAVRDLLHDLHRDLVLITGCVGITVNRRHFMLGRRHLVVLGLGEDAQLPELIVQILHKGGNSGADRAKIVILKFLSSGRLGAKERSACHDQVFALLVQLLVKQKVFLLGAHLGDDPGGSRISEETKNTYCLFAHSIHGAQKRSLLVQRVSGIGAEDRGNAQRLFLNKCKGSGIPGCISSGFEGGAKTAGRE